MSTWVPIALAGVVVIAAAVRLALALYADITWSRSAEEHERRMREDRE